MAGLAASEDKACQVCIGFHWAAKSLLADQGQSVSVINQDEANRIRTCVDPLTEVGHLVADRVNAAILLAAQPEDAVNLKRRLRFEEINKVMEQGGLARRALACEKEMWKDVKALANLLEEGGLAEETGLGEARGSHWCKRVVYRLSSSSGFVYTTQ